MGTFWTSSDNIFTIGKNIPSSFTAGDGIVIDKDGKVGIGTTDPASLLHLSSSATELRIDSSGGSQAARLRMRNIAGGDWYVGAGAMDGGSNYQITQTGAATNGINITTAGNVGIRTATPTHLLNLVTDTDDTNLVLDTILRVRLSYTNLVNLMMC